MADEFERIARLAKRFQRDDPGVVIGIGDDAALLSASPAARVVTVDAAVEGIHFRRSLGPLARIAKRAFLAAASDVVAMGAAPRFALSALVLPQDVLDADVDELGRGLREGADAVGATIVGGNLARGGELSITTTVIGDAVAPDVVTRRGARPGDGIYVNDTLGASALGLAVLLRGGGVAADERRFVERFFEPPVRVELGRALPGFARASIDGSDGFAQDLGHVLTASGVGAIVDEVALPLEPGHDEIATRLGLDPREAPLHGGEDYVLIVAARDDVTSRALGLLRVGEFVEGPPRLTVRGRDGVARDVALRGYTHFR